MPRKRIEIDKKIFENLCALQCTEEEIAAAFGCSPDTIERWCKREYKKRFAEVFAEKRQAGRISLRRAGFKLAQKSAAVHIFYCKNFLGMSDNPDVKPDREIQEAKLELIKAQTAKLKGEDQESEDLTEIEGEIYGEDKADDTL